MDVVNLLFLVKTNFFVRVSRTLKEILSSRIARLLPNVAFTAQ